MIKAREATLMFRAIEEGLEAGLRRMTDDLEFVTTKELLSEDTQARLCEAIMDEVESVFVLADDDIEGTTFIPSAHREAL